MHHMGSVISITGVERLVPDEIPAVRHLHPSSPRTVSAEATPVPTAPCVTSTPLVLEISCEACPQLESSHCEDCVVSHLLASPSVRHHSAEMQAAMPVEPSGASAGEARPLALVRCVHW